MEKLPDGTIEEILSFRNRFEQKMGAVRLSSERDMNIMEDRLFIDFLDALNYTGFVEDGFFDEFFNRLEKLNADSAK